MIVDGHTHIFPPEVLAQRDTYLRGDAAFAALYAEPRARLASAEDLMRSMDEGGIGRSVVLGFSWSKLEDCRRHNDYILEAAAASGGRLIPFCITQVAAGDQAAREVERCAAAGARGIGELRPADQGYGLVATAEGGLLADIARRLKLPLLFHVSEPVGHAYAGKGGLPLSEFAAFATENPDVEVIGAHWGGGLPFFAAMPEVAALLRRVWLDTAASSLLYSADVYALVAGSIGGEHILFGSDFPLLSQKLCRERVEASGLTPEETAAILGGNASRLLGLE